VFCSFLALVLRKELDQRLADNEHRLAFSALVDAVLVFVAQGRTPQPDIQRALALLPKEKISGFVMNRKD
jgi:hypothetical protein